MSRVNLPEASQSCRAAAILPIRKCLRRGNEIQRGSVVCPESVGGKTRIQTWICNTPRPLVLSTLPLRIKHKFNPWRAELSASIETHKMARTMTWKVMSQHQGLGMKRIFKEWKCIRAAMPTLDCGQPEQARGSTGSVASLTWVAREVMQGQPGRGLPTMTLISKCSILSSGAMAFKQKWPCSTLFLSSICPLP